MDADLFLQPYDVALRVSQGVVQNVHLRFLFLARRS